MLRFVNNGKRVSDFIRKNPEASMVYTGIGVVSIHHVGIFNWANDTQVGHIQYLPNLIQNLKARADHITKGRPPRPPNQDVVS